MYCPDAHELKVIRYDHAYVKYKHTRPSLSRDVFTKNSYTTLTHIYNISRMERLSDMSVDQICQWLNEKDISTSVVKNFRGKKNCINVSVYVSVICRLLICKTCFS